MMYVCMLAALLQFKKIVQFHILIVQGGSNMTGTDLCLNKPVTVPVIFEPPYRTNKMHLFLKLFILVTCCTCFRRSFRPSSGAHTAHTATGTCQTEITGVGKITNECVYRL